MKSIDGDLLKFALEGRFDVIIHGCNCFHTMGAGIAKQIKGKFPQAYEADLETPYGSKKKLGKLSHCLIPKGRGFIIVNAYTQYAFGTDKPAVDYDAVRSCFKEIKKEYTKMKIGYPKIGAGLGGGNFEIISKIIDEELKGEDHTLVEYQP
jgi:O-acetyl-ADP-ribose deacetylase (regulator of RNase III)